MNTQTTDSAFAALESLPADADTAEVLDVLIEQLRSEGRYHELFEALKMRLRHDLGLSLLYHDRGDELDAERRRRLEDGLLDACRDVGELLLADGKLAEGWIYLRPIGDRETVSRHLRAAEVTDENLDDLIQIAIHEAVDIEFGFGLVLEHFGTCNAITTFETVMPGRSRDEQQQAARLLVEHLYEELRSSVEADVAQQEGADPTDKSLRRLIADRDWLFGEHAYHVDTTHLAAVVRFARLVDDAATLDLAHEMTEYGRRLAAPFQYQGEPPFEDVYASHARYFAALAGADVDENVAYFRQRAETAEPQPAGTAAREVYVDLLARLGRPRQALEEALRLFGDERPTGFMQTALELAAQAGALDELAQDCRDRKELLGYGAALALDRAEKGG